MENLEPLRNELRRLLDAHHEWLLIRASGRSFALRKNEIEATCERGRLLLGFLDEQGFQTWRVIDFKTKGDAISLNLTRNFERERSKFRLVPRVAANHLSAAVELARLEKVHRLAALLAEQNSRIKLVRVALNQENGRFAQIVFEDARRRQTAVFSDVSESLTPEVIMTAAILWLAKLARRKKNPVESIWIAAEKRAARKLQKLHALLTESWKAKILIKEISREAAQAQSEEVIADLPALRVADLWRAARREIKPAEPASSSRAAREIIAFAPGAIDAVRSARGETLRFNGLPFARVRTVFGRERVWFGIERARRLLTEDNSDELTELLANLRKFRRADSPNKRHAFYRTAPEAWLEAALRRNIKLLDANLILSPLYQQFRAGQARVDLLALRRDGRLVIVELKTSADRAAVFQAAEYWRRIELQRRRGALREARLFGELEIADAPAICYLVAPRLAFHRDFEFLAGTLAPEIEIHRFNLAENWRENLKVFDRSTTFRKS
ncbi:MAG TPA: hypothetical protein VIL74_07755 [Pyrinomonadaceae bacterium]|jgi:hypothetical protein